jgi:hypothetical protein
VQIPICLIRGASDSRPVPGVLDFPGQLDDFREAGADDKDGPAWLPVVLGPAPTAGRTWAVGDVKRCDPCVVSLHALVLDYDVDDRGIPAEDIAARWSGYEHVLHLSLIHI